MNTLLTMILLGKEFYPKISSEESCRCWN